MFIDRSSRRSPFGRMASLLAGTTLLALTACSFSGGSPPSPTPPDEPPVVEPANQPPQATVEYEYAKDSVLVRFKPSATSRQLRNDVLSRVGGSIRDKNGDGIFDGFANLDKLGTMAKIDLAKGRTVEAALAILRADPSIQYAEPNYIQKAFATPNDTRFGELYGLHNTGQTGGTADADIDATEAWDVTQGSRDIVVAVIDTGVDFNHPDLAANIWTNPTEIPGNNVDDDANGFIDDIHGVNTITGTGNPMDDNNHGSHCSGTIGGVGNNGAGVAGVNWQVSIMGIKFLSAGGSGTTADAIEGINYAVGRKNAGVNLRVLSNSWGGGGFSQALMDSITAANAADMLFVAAAGNANSNNDNVPSFPASYDVPNVMSIAATDHNDNRASFSNFGATTVDIAAPGVNVISTIPGGGFASFSGTSMATPHVSGVAALVLSANPTLTTEELKQILITTGDVKPQLNNVVACDCRLNASAAVDAAGPPVPRFALNAAPGSRSVSQGGSTTYDVDVTSVGGFNGNVALTVTSSPPLAGATLSFDPGTVTAPGESTLTVATSCATAAGSYSLTITGTSGDLVKTANVALVVRPFGAVSIDRPSTDTPISIPDNNPTGITSTLNVADSLNILELSAEVHITHTFIGDLLITLTSPTNQNFVLHNRLGGGTDNLHQTFAVPAAAGLSTAGAWKLKVQDLAGIDVGTLDTWTLHFVAAPTSSPPTAAFTFAVNRLTAQFTDGSSDTGCSGGSIASWAWNFGDGTSSTTQNPSHTYSTPGTYTVTLTVTDGDGLTGTVSHDVTVTRRAPRLAIERILRNRLLLEFAVDLTWADAQGTLVDLYRNGILVDIPNNDGVHRDSFRRYETSFTWKLCEQQSDFCSNEVSAVFGSSFEGDVATVITKGADGFSAARVVPIEDVN